jgi:hypothetical protein
MKPYPASLFHYYEAANGPFRSLSTLNPEEADALMDRIRQEGAIFASQRAGDYLAIRRDLEQKIRRLLIDKGGQPQRDTPHYLILGECPWLTTWYLDGRAVTLPLAVCDPQTISFTYGDSFPAMRFGDGKPYRGQVYRLHELPDLIRQYGLPQDWNPDGTFGPDRYIEAQVWDDKPLEYVGLKPSGEETPP